MPSVENVECGKCGVWKMRRKFQFSILISIPMREKQCGRTTGMLTGKLLQEVYAVH